MRWMEDFADLMVAASMLMLSTTLFLAVILLGLGLVKMVLP